jgi:PEGA domain
MASVTVRCNVPEAAVLIDDVLVGRAADLAPPGRSVRPGFHRIEIREEGYFSHYAEITLPEGGHSLVTAELHAVLE